MVPGDVLVLCCRGPLGSGMEETYQVTSALKYLPWGKQVAVLTDARFSGVSTGACIGHVSPEALAGGPIGKLRDGDRIQIVIDRNKLEGTRRPGRRRDGRPRPGVGHGRTGDAAARGRTWPPTRRCRPTRGCGRLLQHASGGVWGGCVYDVDAIAAALHGKVEFGREPFKSSPSEGVK